jgi:GTP cyclohydrolase I
MPNIKENEIDIEKVSGLIKSLLTEIGEDTERDGLVRTPYRVAKAYEFLTHGYRANIEEVINGAVFEEDHNEMVIVRDIDMYSMCEHHMLPFYGKVHVAYIPNGKVLGLSKIPRLVEVFARRLQIQERMTKQIADTLMEVLEPEGVGVVIEAYHMCMMMRGIQKQNSFTVTSAMRGVFMDDSKTRMEFMDLIRLREPNDK